MMRVSLCCVSVFGFMICSVQQWSCCSTWMPEFSEVQRMLLSYSSIKGEIDSFELFQLGEGALSDVGGTRSGDMFELAAM